MKLTKVIGKELTRPVWALITPESSLERRGNNDGEAGWSQKGKCPLRVIVLLWGDGDALEQEKSWWAPSVVVHVMQTSPQENF